MLEFSSCSGRPSQESLSLITLNMEVFKLKAIDPRTGEVLEEHKFQGTDTKLWRQFTGIYDRKGTEIWSGDILKTIHFKKDGTLNGSKGTMIVKWTLNRNHNGWNVKYGKNKEIVGNIYKR